MSKEFKTLKAIAINTIGAGLILISAQWPDEVAAIATISLGFGACGAGIRTAIASKDQELLEARKEALYWAAEARKHLQDKGDLLSKFEDLESQVKQCEDEYAVVMSVLEDEGELDPEMLRKMEKAELN